MSNPIEAIWSLLFSPGEAEKYQANPDEYLQDTGLDQYEPAELHEIVVLAYEKGPVYQGAGVSVGGNQYVGGSSQSAGASAPAYPAPAPAAPPPPPPLDPTLPADEALAQTINYYVSNSTTTNVDDRDTNVDSSVNTTVLAEEGSDVDLDIDNETTTASGDRAVAAGDDVEGAATGDNAVAAGDDINAPVNTGTVEDSILADESNIEGVAIGDDNEVISDSAGSATGGGDASFVDVDIESSGGEVDLENVNFGQGNSIDDSETTTDSFNEDNDITNTDSFNEDNDVTNTATDSFNEDNDLVDDSFNEQSQVGDDSFNDQQVDESFNELDLAEDFSAPMRDVDPMEPTHEPATEELTEL